MARSRSLPTDLFDDPDFFDLNSSTQVILLGLVLFADDSGRGLAPTPSALPSQSALLSSPEPQQPQPGASCDQRSMALSGQVAQILGLPLTAALSRLVTEYQESPGLSLLGEADAAREYIETPQRNRRGQQMSLTFFRRWLQREQQGRLSHQASHSRQPEQGMVDPQQEKQRPTAPALVAQAPPASVSPYQAFVQRREQDLRQLIALTTEEQRPAALKACLLTGKLPERGAHAAHA